MDRIRPISHDDLPSAVQLRQALSRSDRSLCTIKDSVVSYQVLRSALSGAARDGAVAGRNNAPPLTMSSISTFTTLMSLLALTAPSALPADIAATVTADN